ncbi:hypothetical protein [Streptomyces profundus]|uniref:hypothetical protein n=1 Tax=Streptomyces profundus TaxID=2867410 RepID=UPI001D16101C|nr:hypothetical protein [Streptomyces sp. MA3_2.13]UED85004.1 hypothetical protein K4G22_13005 [Streptomyces sp. MA3_2.13]
MEHEVDLPYSADVVLSAFAEPRRVARCVPGLQPAQPGSPAVRDTAPGEVRGRLRLRAGTSTITYRGSLTFALADGGYTVAATGEEARGSGKVSVVLTVLARERPGGAGCTLSFQGRLTGTGRLLELTEEQRHSVGRRLLDRFADALGDLLAEAAAETVVEAVAEAVAERVAEEAATEGAVDEPLPEADEALTEAVPELTESVDELAGEAEPPPTPGGIGAPDDNERVIPGIPSAQSPEPDAVPDAGPDAAHEPRASGGGESSQEHVAEPGASQPAVEASQPAAGTPGDERDAETPPPTEAERVLGRVEAGRGDFSLPAPEADHARRSMIGRSAEEVDHAPPRGRYAPEVAPGGGAGPSPVLRWAAPAAALVVASAVVIGRALRRRR